MLMHASDIVMYTQLAVEFLQPVPVMFDPHGAYMCCKRQLLVKA